MFLEKIYISGYPRSGHHRILQTIYSLMFEKPFEFELYPLTNNNNITLNMKYLMNNGYEKRHSLGNLITGKVICPIRNPIDIAASWFKFIFKNNSLQDSIDYVTKGHIYTKGEYGNWNSNVESYLNRPNTLILKYEEWGEKDLKKICDFCELPYNEDVLKWNEKSLISQKEDIYMKKDNKHRKHITNGDRNIFSQSQIDEIISNCNEVMKKVGY